MGATTGENSIEGVAEVPTTGPAQAVPSRHTAILRSAVVVGILVVVFGVILPRFVDYEEVLDAFRALTFLQVVQMTALVSVAWVIAGVPFVVLIEGLSLARGTASYLILSGIGASIPLGPWNMGILWVVIRSWGIRVQPATSGIALYGVTNQLARLATPVLAVIVLAVAGARPVGGGPVVLITAISTVVFVVAVTLMIAILRSDRAADWLGRTGQRAAAWAFGRLNRAEPPDVNGAIHRFRDQLGGLLRRRGLAALFAAIITQVTWCVVLIAALRIVGVSDDVLTAAEIFAVYALVNVITIIPMSPGGAGIPELLYIAGMSAIAGPSSEALITAGVFLFRLYQWFLPIPIAWILLKLARRGRPMLPGTAELRSYAVDDAPVRQPARATT
jgi:putative heme transporter